MRLASLDIGFSATRASCGAGVWLDDHLKLESFRGWQAAVDWLMQQGSFDLIAIDGPLLPPGRPQEEVRIVERAFMMGAFQRRCKPGASHVHGTGLDLRRAASAAALALAGVARRDGAIVEAFPNAFLGVALGDEIYNAMPRLRRGGKFDYLYDRWIEGDLINRLRPALSPTFCGRFRVELDHEHRAVLVCLMTAFFVARGCGAAAGEELGGWFHLPPYEVWAGWAKAAASEAFGRLGSGRTDYECRTGLVPVLR